MLPSPKSQSQEVGEPVESPEKVTWNGTVPLVGLAEKLATIGETFTQLVWVEMLESAAVATPCLILKLPTRNICVASSVVAKVNGVLFPVTLVAVQFQLVIGVENVEVSVKVTDSGVVPVGGV